MLRSYLKSGPATLLSIVKAALGFVSLILIAVEGFGIWKVVSAFRTATLDSGLQLDSTRQIIENALEYIDATGEAAKFVDTILFANSLLIGFLAVVIIYKIFLDPLMCFLDGVGTVMLRFAGRSGLVRVVHTIRAALALARHQIILVSVIMLLIYREKFIVLTNGIAPEAFLPPLIVAALIAFLQFSYHKDITQVVLTVSDDCDELRPELIRNALPILAILGSLSQHLSAAAALLMISKLDQLASPSELRPVAEAIDVGSLKYIFCGIAVFYLIQGVKYVLVFLSSRALKLDFVERDLPIRRMYSGERTVILIPGAVFFAVVLWFSWSNFDDLITLRKGLESQIHLLEQEEASSQVESVAESVAELVFEIPEPKDDTEVREPLVKITEQLEDIASRYCEFIRKCKDPDNMTFAEKTTNAAFLLQFSDFAINLQKWYDAGLTTAEEGYARIKFDTVKEQYPELLTYLTPESLGIQLPENLKNAMKF